MNVAQQINAVLRRIAHGDGEHTVALEQTFATTADDLWHACTDPERLARWFEPVEGDLVEGGRYKLTGSGTEGTIGRCEPPHALRITWEYGGDVSSVEVDLTPADEGTTLTLRHVVPDNEHWTTYRGE
ncbi:uncharacterized protein YndB with AHSA1/START domain [Prauserella isguenensis]|uniref:Uncharacterized protein YndB with AHSA1/START domain n=1 Tax=Prauserella isguenensis TaxID=1470180 RepID=A0A839RY02_9PSEU|nr:SRPBCC family protein [Prauserella isguenensis]MBB3050651.1 uncharacterized protein YndB with AHSA1/START domain [Prauserella isguenensis]